MSEYSVDGINAHSQGSVIAVYVYLLQSRSKYSLIIIRLGLRSVRYILIRMHKPNRICRFASMYNMYDLYCVMDVRQGSLDNSYPSECADCAIMTMHTHPPTYLGILRTIYSNALKRIHVSGVATFTWIYGLAQKKLKDFHTEIVQEFHLFRLDY